MGKAKKAKKKAHRFDPLARPPAASSSMDVDGDAPIEAPPKVSAHMARFLERKRLQEEVKSLKQQKGKLKGMSKAEKRDVKARKKKLAHEIHERVARSNDKARAAVAPAEAQPGRSAPRPVPGLAHELLNGQQAHVQLASTPPRIVMSQSQAGSSPFSMERMK